MARRSNGEGIRVDTLNYRFKGLELDHNGTLTIDGIDPGDVAIKLDDEDPAPPEPKPGKLVEKIVPVHLRLCKVFKEGESGADRTVAAVSFTLSCDNPKFSVKGTDIEILRKAVWDFLDQQFAVKWEPYLLVKVRPANPWSRAGAGLEFSYSRIEKGTAHDGALLMREFRRHSREGYSVFEWPGKFKDKEGHLVACIPDTPENQAALRRFEQMICELREKLAQFFEPDAILSTLRNLSGLRMLVDGVAVKDEQSRDHDSSPGS